LGKDIVPCASATGGVRSCCAALLITLNNIWQNLFIFFTLPPLGSFFVKSQRRQKIPKEENQGFPLGHSLSCLAETRRTEKRAHSHSLRRPFAPKSAGAKVARRNCFFSLSKLNVHHSKLCFSTFRVIS